ncbi:MAG: hypothetical protein MJA30_31740 [Cytophagales bacterium]|nr:hypothetical protein [Cytophagales bacterium]
MDTQNKKDRHALSSVREQEPALSLTVDRCSNLDSIIVYQFDVIQGSFGQ